MSRYFPTENSPNPSLQCTLCGGIQESERSIGIAKFVTAIVSYTRQEVMDTFRKVTDARPFGYMLLNFHPASRDDQRVMSQMLKEEGVVRCYQFREDVAK